MKRAMMMIASLAALPGCGLLFNADDHVGGSGLDGGSSDGGARDAAIDAADDRNDGGDADVGTDSGPPPSECSVDADCGAPGLARCVAQRCQLCAMPLASPVLISSGTGWVRHFGMAVGSSGGTAEIGLAWIETIGGVSIGPAGYFYRADVTGPMPPSGMANISGAIENFGGATFDRMLSLQVGAAGYGEQRAFDVTALGARTTPESTIRAYLVHQPSGFTSHTFPGPDYVDAPARDLAPLVPTSQGIFGAGAVYRSRRADGTVALEAVEIAYGNPVGAPFESGELPSTEYEPIAYAGGLAALGGANPERIVVWDLSETDGIALETPGRTSNPTLARLSGGDYLVAYGAGSAIHVRGLECTGAATTCTLLAETTSIPTGAERVSLVHMALAPGDVPVLVSYDATSAGTGGRLALRVLRPDHTPYDAPGGGNALAIESFPAGSSRFVPDVDLAVGQTTSGPYYVVGWMRTAAAADAAIDLRLQSIAGACPP